MTIRYVGALLADPYVPERDREVMLSREAYYWVPKEAFELVQSFLDRCVRPLVNPRYFCVLTSIQYPCITADMHLLLQGSVAFAPCCMH